ncbi:MAG: AAA family ATPase [Saprospiraceae bacterium]|nr:AAA family ATPase [Saprospiraceae bacterium]
MNAIQMPKLLIITGLPGTGKTTVATALSERLSAAHFNTDMLRTALGLRGQYDQETKAQVYSILLARAKDAIRDGKTVVIDGTFYQAKLRARFEQLANAEGVPVHWIELSADTEVIRKRVSKQRAYSEADFEVYQKIKESYEPILAPHLSLRSEDTNLQHLIGEILSYLRSQQKNRGALSKA